MPESPEEKSAGEVLEGIGEELAAKGQVDGELAAILRATILRTDAIPDALNEALSNINDLARQRGITKAPSNALGTSGA